MASEKLKYLGFAFKPTSREKLHDTRSVSFAPPISMDEPAIAPGAIFPQNGLQSSIFDSSEFDLISRYRMMEQDPIVGDAVGEITDEAIVFDDGKQPVYIEIGDKAELSSFITEKIIKEFGTILDLINFKVNGDTLFRRWYVDGRLVFHKIIDHENPHYGMLEVRRIEPFNIKRIMIPDIVQMPSLQGINLFRGTNKVYYMYMPAGFSNAMNMANPSSANTYYSQQPQQMQKSVTALNLTEDSICFVPSGLIDYSRGTGVVVSYLNQAIKPQNQLSMMEDLMVIYQLTRGIDRRVFHVDVGNMLKRDAEAYMQEQVDRYRTKIAYDTTTGTLTSRNNYMAIQEDIWVPKRGDGGQWSVDTLEAGKTMEDNKGNTMYFLDKLYRSLHLPPSRLGEDKGFRIGNPNEINRDEVRFSKFINKLRGRFAHMFYDLLKTQVLLKGILTPDEWDDVVKHIRFEFRHDVYFAELKQNEILRGRIEMFQAIQPLVSQGYFSHKWVRQNILQQSTEEYEEMQKQIVEEKETEGEDQNQNFEEIPGNDFSSAGFDLPGSSASSPAETQSASAPPEFNFEQSTETSTAPPASTEAPAAPSGGGTGGLPQ